MYERTGNCQPRRERKESIDQGHERSEQLVRAELFEADVEPQVQVWLLEALSIMVEGETGSLTMGRACTLML